MKSKYESLAKAALGDSLYEALNKAITKIPTKTVVDITEAHDALEIAPKSVLTFLYKEIKSMKDKEAKEVELPFGENARIRINKLTADQYSGDIVQNGKVVHAFQFVSIPQLSAHLLSAFELYDEKNYSDKSSVESKSEASSSHEETSDADIWEHLKSLEEKVNQLFMLAASQKPQVIVNNVTEESSVHGDHEINEGSSSSEESMSKSELEKATKAGKLYGSDSSKEGITNGIKKFYYGTNVTLHPNAEGNHDVHNSSGPIEGVHVREHKGRWRFEAKPETTKKAEILEKPYRSDAQRRWAHTATGEKALGGPSHVKEWDQATKGKKIPEKVRKALKKAGVMPQPPKAGSNVGGQQGLTTAGVAKPVTTAAPPKGTSIGMPAKAPKAPKPIGTSNTVTFKKSELVNQCLECKSNAGYCQCFKAFSKPVVAKSEKESITIKFRSDWDKDAIRDLFRSIQRAKNDE
jgi:hypothetical protein